MICHLRRPDCASNQDSSLWAQKLPCLGTGRLELTARGHSNSGTVAVNHDIMLETSESRFFVTEEARSWFQSYLTQINQVYCVGLEVSQPIPLKYGVPQGSVAGSINFICYTEYVEVVNWSSPIFMYDITCTPIQIQIQIRLLQELAEINS